MMGNTIGKLQFDNSTPFYYSTEEFIVNQFGNKGTGIFKIELLEVYNISNPSDLQITIKTDFGFKETLSLWKHRTDFLLQKDIFILNTAKIDFFNVQLNAEKYFHNRFRIDTNIQKEEFCKIVMYYSIEKAV